MEHPIEAGSNSNCPKVMVEKRAAKQLLATLLALALLAVACGRSTEPQDLRHLVILYTNDEHGWMEATETGGGAAGMMGLWREQEGYTEDGPYLILSGGDMWTGPAISTWFDGESMVEVMNAMGYDAAAVGNHEFDYGLDGLRLRAAQSEFPFLSANIRSKGTGGPADIVVPYVVQEVNGIQVGLIGLTTTSTPRITEPRHVAGLDFLPYEETLAEVVPQARADGAELIIVVGHLCSFEMLDLAPKAAELGVAVIGGGHCHEQVSRVVKGVALVQAGAYMEGYVRVALAFDQAADRLVEVEPQYRPNRGGEPDPEIQAIVTGWRAEADEALGEVIGYVEQAVGHRSDPLFNLVTDAWLAAYPAADVALTNEGGFRQAIPAGEITLQTIVGVLPFDNVLIDAELTGAQLVQNIVCCQPVVGGMTTLGEYELADGTPIDPTATYHVLINDFIYAGGDGFMFREQDPDAYDTGIDWRQPVIDWIGSFHTSSEEPLDKHLDAEPRQ